MNYLVVFARPYFIIMDFFYGGKGEVGRVVDLGFD